MDGIWALLDLLPAFDLIGLLGVVVYIASYGSLQLGKLDGNSLLYTLLNGTAAALVLVSLTRYFNLASAIIQIMWISISIVGVYRYFSASRGTDRRKQASTC